MKKVSLLIMTLIVAGSILLSLQVFAQSSRKVLMIPREGYSSDTDLVIKMEVGEMKRVLQEAGFEVDIATTSGQPILGQSQYIYGVLKLSEINVKRLCGHYHAMHVRRKISRATSVS